MLTSNWRLIGNKLNIGRRLNIAGKLATAARWFMDPLPDFGQPVSADGQQELFHTVLPNLPQDGGEASRPIGIVGVTSCYPGEGVTTIATGMATTAAGTAPRKVLLIDANVIQPALHVALSIERGPGLAEYALATESPTSLIQSTHVDNLFAISAGLGEAARVYRAADRLTKLFTHIKKHFDLVIVDLPSAAQSPMAMDSTTRIGKAVATRRHPSW